MKKLTPTEKSEIFQTSAAEIDRYPQPEERRNHLKAYAFIVISEEPRGLVKATNRVGYAVKAALNMLRREENEYNQHVSLNEEDEDGRLKFEPAAPPDSDPAYTPKPDKESKLSKSSAEFVDFLRVFGKKELAKKLKCTVRTVESKLKKLIDNQGDESNQGDLFGGVL